MKFNEFKKKVEGLNYGLIVKFNNGETKVHVTDKHGNNTAVVSNTKVGMLDFYFFMTEDLNENTRLQLLGLIYEFAKTPLDERVEEVKYYLEYKGNLILSYSSEIVYLNQWKEKEEVFEFDDHVDNKSHRTQFTQEEIDELPVEFKLMLEHGYLEKVKVNEDEN